MTPEQHAVFLDALAQKRRVSLRFFDRKLDREVVAVCAPLDFGPLRGALEKDDRYQLWNLEGKRKPLNIVVRPADVVALTLLDETFDPAAIITWSFKPNAWSVPRDWAEFS